MAIRKLITLSPGAYRDNSSFNPNTYANLGDPSHEWNRDYIRYGKDTLSGYIVPGNVPTWWVKFWVSWFDLQNELSAAPSGWPTSWSQLNTAPGGQLWLRNLDKQIAKANADGRAVILGLYQAFPTWSNGQRDPNNVGGPGYFEPNGSGKPGYQKVPTDVSTSSPYAWFVSHLCARYKAGAGINPVGPHYPGPGEPSSVLFGNPEGAWINFLEVCNEPNQNYWVSTDDVAAYSAAMMSTAAQAASLYGWPAILGPGTGDISRNDGEFGTPTANPSISEKCVDYYDYTQRTLQWMQYVTFPTNVYVGWSHHNYHEVERWATTYTPTSPRTKDRADDVISLLYQYNWKHGGDRYVLLTEGSYRVNRPCTGCAPTQTELNNQAAQIQNAFTRASARPDMYMYAQYLINEVAPQPAPSGRLYYSSLRDQYIFGPPAAPGAARPAWQTWAQLPAPAGP